MSAIDKASMFTLSFGNIQNQYSTTKITLNPIYFSKS
jgi:hypothetical protein